MEFSDNAIKCVFIGHFHCVLGPRVMYQVPTDYVSKELFYSLSTYIIPRIELSQYPVTVISKNTKLVGRPVTMKDPKYKRNMFYFNICFVFDVKSETSQYEPVLKKLSDFFLKLEIESMYLYKSEQSPETQKHIISILDTVWNGLNMHKKCYVRACDYMIHLCVLRVAQIPPIPSEFDVPVFVFKVDLKEDDWDLATRQIGLFIDGVNHIARIAELSTLDIEVVSACIQHLVYYNVVTLVDLFRYSNMYVCTIKIRELVRKKDQFKKAVDLISRPNGPKTTIRNILIMFSAMRQGARLMDVCMRFNPVLLNINERNLVLYGLINGYIRHLKKYPLLLKEEDVNLTYLGQYYNGINSLESVSNYNNVDLRRLDNNIEEDLRIMSIWK